MCVCEINVCVPSQCSRRTWRKTWLETLQETLENFCWLWFRWDEPLFCCSWFWCSWFIKPQCNDTPLIQTFLSNVLFNLLELCWTHDHVPHQTKRDEPSAVVDYQKIDDDARVSFCGYLSLFLIHHLPLINVMLQGGV